MATLNLFDVEFEVVRKSAGGAGNAYVSRRGARRAQVSAASAHPKDLLTVLNADVPVLAGETIEILSVRGVSVGTEGSAVLS